MYGHVLSDINARPRVLISVNRTEEKMQVFQALHCASLEILTKHTLNMKRNIISCASALFFLAVFSCERDKPDPECRDASCCGYPWEYARYIQDEPVSLTGPPYSLFYSARFTKQLPSKEAGAPFPTSEASICHKSLYRIEGFPLTHRSKATPDSFPYRVSGKLLILNNRGPFYNPSFALYIDRIEKIN